MGGSRRQATRSLLIRYSPVFLSVEVGFRLALREAPSCEPGRALRVVEVAPDALERRLAGAELLVGRSDDVGYGPWRAFVVLLNDRPVHHSFVNFPRGTPQLFQVYTHPDWRGRGAFRQVIAFIARELLADGHEVLTSSCGASNAPSIAAHQRAGFRVVRRAYHPYLFRRPLRPMAGRCKALIRGTAARLLEALR